MGFIRPLVSNDYLVPLQPLLRPLQFQPLLMNVRLIVIRINLVMCIVAMVAVLAVLRPYF